MNCTFHPQSTAAGECRTCARPLCLACTTTVLGFGYCGECLVRRLSTEPSAGTARLKRPWLAGVLSMMPGLGQVYNGFVVRGLAQFTAVFFMASLLDESRAFGSVLVVGWLGLYFWQIIDAVRSAREINKVGRVPDAEEARELGSLPIRGITATPRVVGLVLMVVGGLMVLGHFQLGQFLRQWLVPLGLAATGAWLFFRVRQEESAVKQAGAERPPVPATAAVAASPSASPEMAEPERRN